MHDKKAEPARLQGRKLTLTLGEEKLWGYSSGALHLNIENFASHPGCAKENIKTRIVSRLRVQGGTRIATPKLILSHPNCKIVHFSCALRRGIALSPRRIDRRLDRRCRRIFENMTKIYVGDSPHTRLEVAAPLSARFEIAPSLVLERHKRGEGPVVQNLTD